MSHAAAAGLSALPRLPCQPPQAAKAAGLDPELGAPVTRKPKTAILNFVRCVHGAEACCCAGGMLRCIALLRGTPPLFLVAALSLPTTSKPWQACLMHVQLWLHTSSAAAFAAHTFPAAHTLLPPPLLPCPPATTPRWWQSLCSTL